MRYWDTSAILPLIVDEAARERVLELYEEDSEIVAWWAAPVEIASAALIAANHDPVTLEMICVDSRLTAAARREGIS